MSVIGMPARPEPSPLAVPCSPDAEARDAMRRLIALRGFDGAVEDLATVVAVEIVPDDHPDADRRMEQVATLAAAAIVDSLVRVARTQKWRGAR